MTVQDLIAQLEQYDPETPVHFAYPAGDYWHTTLAREAQSTEEMRIKYSRYHSQFQLVDDEEEDDDEQKSVVVLS